MRSMILFGIFVNMVFATAQPIRAQTEGGNAKSGRALAKAWCAECHRVKSDTPSRAVADFMDVANLPSTTTLSLRVFLQTSHKDMPNLTLKPTESDDVIAYILSLKRR